MENVMEFLDASTIHGLSWISSTRSWSRLFWILIVFGGFSVAGYLIHTSFYNWEQSPISTTIETLPISKMTFPNVTVCPPKNSFLNLNYDIKQSENINFDKNTRKELFEFALDVIQDESYKEIITNMSKVEDPHRYYKWYHGYTDITYPYYSVENNKLFYYVYTSTTTGNISTQHFREMFDASKVDGYIHILINVFVPKSVKVGQNTTLMFDIEKTTMNEVSDNDQMSFCFNCKKIDADLAYWSKNITDPFYDYYIELVRKVAADDINNTDLDMMPGFRFTWSYNKHVEPWKKFSTEDKTKQFVRLLFCYTVVVNSTFTSGKTSIAPSKVALNTIKID